MGLAILFFMPQVAVSTQTKQYSGDFSHRPQMLVLPTLIGRISLYYEEDRGRSEAEMEFAEGNIYLDEQPVCDDQWGVEEAKVACRSVKRWSLDSFLVETHIIARMLGFTDGLPRQQSAYGTARKDEEFAITEVC